ncbi:MAG: hypothetical protein KC620_17435, partial [Myxococcales bacterium]|nr:hypothetical protein [Myxococcales bacterium]
DRASWIGEYRRGRDIINEILAEVTTYLRDLDNRPAVNEMTDIQARLDPVVDDLTALVDRGFEDEGMGGLTDEDYLYALIRLRDVARISTGAGNAGVYVRVYQFSMMQVVRWMTHFSLTTAREFLAVNLPLFDVGFRSIEDGVSMLDDREIQAVIDLYGSEGRALCPIIGTYHCWFIRDEGQNDGDRTYPVDLVPDVCWDLLLQPGQWAGAPADPIDPQCRWFGDDLGRPQ